MKKIFSALVLFVFLSLFTGCTFWSQNNDTDVSALIFYIYDDLQKVNAELTVTPDYSERTLAVVLMKYSVDNVDKENPGFVETNEGVIGGSNFENFEELLNQLDDLVAAQPASPMMTVVVERAGDEKSSYSWDVKLDDPGREFYDFYASLAALFAQDVY